MSELIPAGYYDGELLPEGTSLTESKNGTPEFKLTFDIPSLGVQRRVALYLSDGALPYSLEKLKSFGWNNDFESPAFTSTKARLSCKHDQYNGQTREKWDVYVERRANPGTIDLLRSKVRSMSAPAPARVVAKAPPPKPSGPPPVAAKDRNWAWNEIVNTHGEATATRVWQSNINAVATATGKTEENFGPEEWTKFVTEFIPF